MPTGRLTEQPCDSSTLVSATTLVPKRWDGAMQGIKILDVAQVFQASVSNLCVVKIQACKSRAGTGLYHLTIFVDLDFAAESFEKTHSFALCRRSVRFTVIIGREFVFLVGHVKLLSS